MSYLRLIHYPYPSTSEDFSTAKWKIGLGDSPDSFGFFTYRECNWKVKMIYDRPQLRSVTFRYYVSPIDDHVTKGAVNEKIRLSIIDSFNSKLWSLEEKVQFEFSQNSDAFHSSVKFDPEIVNMVHFYVTTANMQSHGVSIEEDSFYLVLEFIPFEEFHKNVEDYQLVRKLLEPPDNDEFYKNIKDSQLVTEKSEPPDNDWEELSEDMLSLLLSEDDYDVTLNVCGRSFKAHRNILSWRCLYFNRMFKDDLKEKKTGTVDLLDDDPDAFEAYLRYLYSGKFNAITVGNVRNLYLISDKYGSKRLVQKCLRFMMDNLSIDNCGEFLAVILNDLDASSCLEAVKRFFADIYGILENVPRA